MASDMEGLIKLIFAGLAMATIALGIFLISRPKKVIERQIKFYKLINWKMEPVSWEKEIRNTRIMGIIAFVCGVLIVFVSFCENFR